MIICCVAFFNFTVKGISLLIGATIIFIYAWVTSFRKLEIVYLGNQYLEVNGEKILFENITSVEKISIFRYKVTYQIQDIVKSFIFMVDVFPLGTPDYIKEMRECTKMKT